MICYILLKIVRLTRMQNNTLKYRKCSTLSQVTAKHLTLRHNICMRENFLFSQTLKAGESQYCKYFLRKEIIINLSLVVIIEEHMVWYQHFINAIEKDFKYYEAKAKDLKRQCNIAQFAKHQFIRLREFLI